MRFGAGFWGPFPLRRYVDYATLTERSGFDVAWFGDTQLLMPDLYSVMALCASATSTVLLGSSCTNTVTRHATVTAGAMLALNEFSGGRCLLGVGVGGSAVHTVGLPEDRVGEFRQKLEVMKTLVRGAPATTNGVEARGKIAAPPVPVYVASSSPLMLQLAGEMADGVILNVGVAPELVQEALKHVERGARRAGRDLSALDIAVFAGSAISAESSRAIEETRSWAATTARRVAKWVSSGDDEMRSAGAAILAQYDWSEHITVGAAHARRVSDAMARSFVFAGTVDEVAQSIKRLEACGVTQVIALPMGSRIEATLEAFGREIIPAWRTPTLAGSPP
jgi:5,10-methylenetetrahydromethanopterin reductase